MWRKYSFILFFVMVMTNCKKSYNPAVIQSGNNYLVVDGVINVSPNGISSIHLTRSRNLGDSSVEVIPETNASVRIVGSGGNAVLLLDSANDGVYKSASVSLSLAESYRFEITSRDGREYMSDFVTPQITPAIDSLYWEQPDDLNFYVDTHDPTNSTKYYRWDYVETWAHDATLSTPWYVENGMIKVAGENTQTTNCWSSQQSSNITLASTVALGEDVVSHQKLLTIPNGDSRLDKRYSLLLRQYALSEDAYSYWLLIQKTSQQLGGLFDPQPAQLISNIHCITNPAEPVIGYASASSISEQRIFLYNTNLTSWGHNGVIYTCDTLMIPVNPTDYRIYNYPDTSYAPYYFITNGPLVISNKRCLDCRLFGGTNIKPSFW